MALGAAIQYRLLPRFLLILLIDKTLLLSLVEPREMKLVPTWKLYSSWAAFMESGQFYTCSGRFYTCNWRRKPSTISPAVSPVSYNNDWLARRVPCCSGLVSGAVTNHPVIGFQAIFSRSLALVNWDKNLLLVRW